jgi:hypothetical protein
VRDVKRLTRLLTDKIETVDPGFGIELMRLAAAVAEPLGAKQMIFLACRGARNRRLGYHRHPLQPRRRGPPLVRFPTATPCSELDSKDILVVWKLDRLTRSLLNSPANGSKRSGDREERRNDRRRTTLLSACCFCASVIA